MAADITSLSPPPAETPPDVYDVFISHAGEDKKKVARPLARQLETLGFRVWLDDTEITVGDSLRAVIDRGLSNSRFGVVILSPSFFKKSWPQYELDGLLAKCGGNRKIILPVWHRVTRDEVANFSLGLAGLAAVSTTFGIKEVANRISRAILREPASKPHTISPPRHAVVNLRRLKTALMTAATVAALAAQGPDLSQHTSQGKDKGAQTTVALGSPEPSSSAQSPVLATKPKQVAPGLTTDAERKVPAAPQAAQAEPGPTLGRYTSYKEFKPVINSADVDSINRTQEAARMADNFRRIQETQRTLESLKNWQDAQRALEAQRSLNSYRQTQQLLNPRAFSP